MEVETQEQRVLEANEAFYASFNHKDMAAMERIWSARPDVSCIHPGWNVLSGREAVIDSWASILGNPAQPRIVVGGAQVCLVGETAIVLCRELVAGSPLAATNVFILESGEWRIIHHQSGPVASLA